MRERTRFCTSSSSNGLPSTPSAPRLSPISPMLSCPLSTITGMSEVSGSDLSLRRTSAPSSPGRRMSRVIRAGRARLAIISALSPSSTGSTRKPSPSSSMVSTSLTSSLSSTTITMRCSSCTSGAILPVLVENAFADSRSASFTVNAPLLSLLYTTYVRIQRTDLATTSYKRRDSILAARTARTDS